MLKVLGEVLTCSPFGMESHAGLRPGRPAIFSFPDYCVQLSIVLWLLLVTTGLNFHIVLEFLFSFFWYSLYSLGILRDMLELVL